MHKQKVIIRVDGNSNIGLGHIYRGIALAQMLKDEFEVSFITKSTSTTSPIVDVDFKYETLPENTELLDEPIYFNNTLPKNTIIVLDGYDFTEEYQQKIKEFKYKLVYIDDLANGTQKADLVINHSPGIKKSDYKTEEYTKLALGLDYALLRQPFINFDRSNVKRNNRVENVLVSFGGADPKDFTYKTVIELIGIVEIKQIDVILGAVYKHTNIMDINNSKLKIHRNLFEKQVFDIMNNADLAIVPASTTSLELYFLGVPMALGYYIDNQKGIYKGLVEKGDEFLLGNFNSFDFKKLFVFLQQNNIIKDKKKPSNPNKSILKEFHLLNLRIREIEVEDMDFVFKLSNEILVRESSYNSESIQYLHHKNWFARQLIESKNYFFIIEYNNNPCGQVRFIKNNNKAVIGISVSNDFRGKGIATAGLIVACNNYFVSNSEQIVAYIKKINIASIKSFERAGFIYKRDEVIQGIDSFIYVREKNI